MNDYKNRYQDRIEQQLDHNTKLTEQILVQAKQHNGRLTRVEGEIKDLQKWKNGQQSEKPLSFPSWLVKTTLTIVVLTLIIIATLLGVENLPL